MIEKIRSSKKRVRSKFETLKQKFFDVPIQITYNDFFGIPLGLLKTYAFDFAINFSSLKK
jgi:hypothetical protein